MSRESEYQKIVRDSRRKNHLCIKCGNPLSKARIRNHNTRCSRCIKRLKTYIQGRINRLLLLGICVSCGKESIDTSTNPRLCKTCFNKSKMWERTNIESMMLASARHRAKEKKFEFSIDKSDIVIPEYCPLLGIKLEKGKLKLCESSPSLDRIDNSKGYIKGNVWVISYKANRIKQNATIEELEMLTRNLRDSLTSH